MIPDQPASPWRHDPVTIPCPVCGQPFTPLGRQAYCSGACRAAAYRRRRNHQPPPPALPTGWPRRPITVYECDSCGNRALGDQRCDDCGTWMRRVGVGGHCPACDEPIALSELTDAWPPHQ